jgi:hypothetical protein
MRYIISILLIVISLNSFSQFNKTKLKKTAYFTSSILLDASGDASKDFGNKQVGHLLEAASVGVLLLTPFDNDMRNYYYTATFKDVVLDAVLYAGLRYVFFNLAYNLVAGLPWDYIGNTDYVDQLTRELGQFSKVVTFTFIIGLERNR